MKKKRDLSRQVFGNPTVIGPAEDHITPSGQHKRRWVFGGWNMIKICKKCGNEFEGSPHQWYCFGCKQKVIEAQRKKELDRVKSKVMEHTCVICGKKFLSYFDSSTCSPECTLQYRKSKLTGREVTEKTREKIGDKNCIEWHLISPEGKHYRFENLNKWASENSDLFGFAPNPQNVSRICIGIARAKTVTMGLIDGSETYKDWKIVIIYGPTEIVRLFKFGYSINRIHEISGLSNGKIRKILIDKGMWENDLFRKIKKLRDEGVNDQDIQERLGITSKTLNNYSEYTKTIYNWKKTKNAQKICDYRKKIKDEDKKV